MEYESKLSSSSKNDNSRLYYDPDNDKTFLPPALSSYSIGLFNDKSKSPTMITNNQVSGIYDDDFPNINRLKQRLSQHFRNTNDSKLEISNDIEKDLPNSISNLSHVSGTANTSGNSFTSRNNSHLASHVSINTSLHNSQDDIEQANSLKVSSSLLSEPSKSTSSIHTLKRRSIRRLGKVLGPPQRARKVSLPDQDLSNALENKSNTSHNHNDINNQNINDIDNNNNNYNNNNNINNNNNYNNNNNNNYNTNNNNEKNYNIDVDQNPNFNDENFSNNYHSLVHIPSDHSKDINNISIPSRSIVTPNRKFNPESHPISRFSPSLESNIYRKGMSPGKDILSKENELELRRRIDQQKIRNQENFHKQMNSSSDRNAQKRIPLKQISSSNLNSEENFRKPKVPKLNGNFADNFDDVMKKSPLKLKIDYSHQQEQTPAGKLQNPPKPDEKKKKLIFINGHEYEKLELLGRGGSSKVYKVKSVANTRLFAIKKVRFDQFDDSCVKGFKGEIDLLLRLKHSDRVVKLIDHAIGDGSIYLVMECGELDLAHVFQNRINTSKTLDLQFVKYHVVEMLKCVQAVHEADIVHSDLKPANFLFVKGMLKIIDFGIANAVPDHTANIYRESQIGTPNYMAPEALIETNQPFPGVEKNTWKVGKPSDVWSCGCIMYQMIYGKPPYGGYSGNQRIMAIINPQVKIQFPEKGLGGVRVPASAIELMKNCLARNPNDRWTIKQCLHSDFLDPKIVNESFIRDLIHLSVNFGYQSRVNGGNPIPVEVYDQLVATVISQIKTLNYG